MRKDASRTFFVLCNNSQTATSEPTILVTAKPTASPDTLRDLFRAQIEAAKHIQRQQLARPRQPEIAGADLAAELRPALIRIGDRIAALTAQLPDDPDEASLRAAAKRALSARDLEAAHINAIADALLRLARD